MPLIEFTLRALNLAVNEGLEMSKQGPSQVLQQQSEHTATEITATEVAILDGWRRRAKGRASVDAHTIYQGRAVQIHEGIVIPNGVISGLV